jgi:hypothetical protein
MAWEIEREIEESKEIALEIQRLKDRCDKLEKKMNLILEAIPTFSAFFDALQKQIK